MTVAGGVSADDPHAFDEVMFIVQDLVAMYRYDETDQLMDLYNSEEQAFKDYLATAGASPMTFLEFINSRGHGAAFTVPAEYQC